MTISNQTRTAGPYIGTGLVVSYPFAFKVFQTSDLLAVRSDLTNAQSTLVLGVDYTAALNSDQDVSPGGTITLTSALTAGYSLTLTSNIPVTQTASLTNTGGYFPKTIENALDRLTILFQQLGLIGIAQAIRVPEIGGVPLLPLASSRANNLLGFDSLGNPVAVAPVSGSAASLATDLTSSVNSAKGSGQVGFGYGLGYAVGTVGRWLQDLATSAGSSFIGFIQSGAGAVLRTLQAKGRDTVNLLDFGAAGVGGDDTPFFQLAVNSRRTVFVPKGNYSITTVNIDVYGCDIRLDKEAVVTVTGNGFLRNLAQTLRATWLSTNNLLDATNYYYSVRISGGSFIVGGTGTAISDRVPFLVYTGIAPAPVNAGIQLQKSLVVTDTNITLTGASSIGIGIHGGWGSTVKGCTIQGYNVGTGIQIGGDGSQGDVSCHPQEINVLDTVFASCKPITSIKGSCNNSFEDLNVSGCKFNFVQELNIDTGNVYRWKNNLFVSDNDSMVITDTVHTTLEGAYFESDHDPSSAAKRGIVNTTNCSNLKVLGCDFFALATPVAIARDGIVINSNSTNACDGTLLHGIRGIHSTKSGAIETNLIRFVQPGGAGQHLNVCVKDVHGSDWFNAVNFTDCITNLVTGVQLENIDNTGGTNFVKGIARLAVAGIRALGIWEQFSFVISGQSRGGSVASNVLSMFWPTVMKSAAPVVTVSNFVNLAGCNGITASWAAIGANSVHIVGAQTVASALNDLVQGQATITIDGTAV